MADVPADLRLQMRLLSPAMSPDRKLPASQEHTASQYLILSPKLRERESGRAWAWGSMGPGLGADIHARESLLPVPSASLATQSSHLQPIWSRGAQPCSGRGHVSPCGCFRPEQPDPLPRPPSGRNSAQWLLVREALALPVRSRVLPLRPPLARFPCRDLR